MTDNIYQNKYLKYKLKYNNLKKSFENTGGKIGLWIKGKYYIICDRQILEDNIDKLNIRDFKNNLFKKSDLIKEENENNSIYEMVKNKKLRFNMNDFDKILLDNFYYWSPKYPIKKNINNMKIKFFKNYSTCKIDVNIPDFNNNKIKVENNNIINNKDNQEGSKEIFNALFNIIVDEENKIIKQKIIYRDNLFNQLNIFNEYVTINKKDFTQINTTCEVNEKFSKCKWVGLLVDVGTSYSVINKIYKFN